MYSCEANHNFRFFVSKNLSKFKGSTKNHIIMTKTTQAVNKYKKAVGMPPSQDSFLKMPNIGKLNKNKPKMDKPMSFVALFCMVFFILLKMGIKGLSK